MDRIDRIGSTTMRTERVPPVAAPGRVERRESDAERRWREQQRRRPRPQEPSEDAAGQRDEPVLPGRIDVSA